MVKACNLCSHFQWGSTLQEKVATNAGEIKMTDAIAKVLTQMSQVTITSEKANKEDAKMESFYTCQAF